MTVILFILILAVLVFVHELGHFLAAKAFGIRVDEFAIGFPPRILGWKKGETQYSLNLIPFGGYVKIFGENPDEESLNGVDKKRSLVHAAKWKQIVVLLSGVFMNLVFAWVLISLSLNIGLLTSIDDQYKDKAENVMVMVETVLKDSPAEHAGFKEGDEIISITSNKKEIQIQGITQVQNIIAESNGPMEVIYKRNNATGTLSVIPVTGVVSDKKGIGISMGLVGTIRFNFLTSFYQGAKLTGYETKNIAIGIYEFIKGALHGESGLLKDVAGPVGIASMVGEARSMGISYLLGFIAIISLNLSVLNFVPFPAFDGGRVLFVLIEAISRKRIKPIILNWINGIGFALIILLMIFITYRDILRLIK